MAVMNRVRWITTEANLLIITLPNPLVVTKITVGEAADRAAMDLGTMVVEVKKGNNSIGRVSPALTHLIARMP
jgi:hypothetical protein